MHTATTILGIPVDHLTLAQAVDQMAGMIAAGGAHQVATINPEFVMAAQQNLPFRTVLQQADLCVADGVGLLLAARWQKRPLPERVTGNELLQALAERAAAAGWSFFFLGAAPGVAESAAAALQHSWPALRIAGCYAGSPRPEEAAAIIERVRTASPDILLVAYGAPAQDVWIARCQTTLQVPLAIGVGGAFDFLAGRVPRAPRWMQCWGLEWLFRLLRQPWRWRRMLSLPRFAWAAWQERQRAAQFER